MSLSHCQPSITIYIKVVSSTQLWPGIQLTTLMVIRAFKVPGRCLQ